jgi:hypothetical protein
MYINPLASEAIVNKRGQFFFVLDVIVAVLILITTIVLLSTFFTPRNTIGGTQQYMDILQEDFFSQQVADLSDPILASIPDEFEEPDLRIDQLLYYLYLEGEIDAAQDLFINLTSFIPPQYGVRYGFLGVGLERPSTRTSFTEADIILTRKQVTTLNPRYCPSACLFVTSEVKIWS